MDTPQSYREPEKSATNNGQAQFYSRGVGLFVHNKNRNVLISNNLTASKTPASTQPIGSAMALDTNKAGLADLKLDKINEILLSSSAGTAYLEHKKKEQEGIDKKVADMKKRHDALCQSSIEKSANEVEHFIKRIEENIAEDENADTIVHVDMDAFFAAVEIRECFLKGQDISKKPVAVGSNSMLSTSNYVARKSGVRSGMPGFVGKKLCPELIIIPLDMEKYIGISERIQGIVRAYDYTANMHMDEVRINISDVVRNSLDPNCASSTVKRLREDIFRVTGLTASAGIASNSLLAKICSNIEKPNGQYQLSPNREKVKEFLAGMPVQKVPGIGKVTSKMLEGIGIKTLDQLYEKRAIVNLLFSTSTAHFLIAASLGLGGGSYFSDGDLAGLQKSMSFERTFLATDDMSKIARFCEDVCVALAEDMENKKVQAKTITIKVKTSSHEVKMKSTQSKYYTNRYQDIFLLAQVILKNFGPEFWSQKIRLLGVRVSDLRMNPDEDLEFKALPPPFRRTKQTIIRDYMIGFNKRKEQWEKCPICMTALDPDKSLRSHVNACLDRSERDNIARKSGNSTPKRKRSESPDGKFSAKILKTI